MAIGSGSNGSGGGRRGARPTGPALALYQELRGRGASSLRDVASEMGLTDDERDRCRDELIGLGLVVPTGPAHDDRLALRAGGASEAQTDAVTVITPEIALLRLLDQERARLRDHMDLHGRIKALAESFLQAGPPERAAGAEVEILRDYRRIQQVLEDITDTVRHTLRSMHPVVHGREIPERALGRDRRQIEKGVHVRSIFSRRLTSVPEDADHLRAKARLGVQVRISPVVPMNMVIADEQFALLPVDPANVPAGAILARGSALVRSYLTLFEHCWHSATPYGEQDQPVRSGEAITEQQRAALRMLASGMKDEQVARGLGVSVRTVSRMISELMQELGASSRFEAGVRAGRVGWLD